MPGSFGTPIVEEALRLAAAQPNLRALSVLDEVMEGHRGSHPDFEVIDKEFDDWLCPPSPFAELLHQAFDPELTQYELQLMVTHRVPAVAQERVRLTEDRWHKIIDAFGLRYELWDA